MEGAAGGAGAPCLPAPLGLVRVTPRPDLSSLKPRPGWARARQALVDALKSVNQARPPPPAAFQAGPLPGRVHFETKQSCLGDSDSGHNSSQPS